MNPTTAVWLRRIDGWFKVVENSTIRELWRVRSKVSEDEMLGGLAENIAMLAWLRNILVHRYIEMDTGKLYNE